jgi:CubicO group peptidase (beta-lactamase class C family)
MIRITSFLISFLFVITSGLQAQSTEQFHKAAMSALEAFDTPGFSVGIIKDGEVIMSTGFGTRTNNRVEPVDGATIYAIASNSKAFIATAIARLHEEGKLDLDAPVQQYLPYFKLYDGYVSQHTTVRDLLCHRVGLGTYSGDALWYKSEKSAEEIIKQIQHLPQAYEWRAGYGYTNLMFITAGEVIKAVTGQRWSEYVQSNFLDPLKMNRTQTSVRKLTGLDNIATPHITHRDNMPIAMAPWEASGAAGGILSSTDDMLKWLNVQLNPGKAEEAGIFSKAARNQCMTPHNAIRKDNFYSAGLGWFLYMKGSQTIVTHGGGYDGMYSRVIMIPEMNIGIVVLTNSMTGLSSAVANYIRDSYLELETTDWLEKAIKAEEASRTKWQDKFTGPKEKRVLGTSSTVEHTEIIGKYYDPLYGNIEVSSDNKGVLTLDFEGAPALSTTLSHWHYDTWEIKWEEEHAWFDFGTVQFILDNNQKVSSLLFHVPNDDIFFEEIHAKAIGN